ncbi:sensor histidine kinase ColS [Pseudomonas sp. M47T1]|uniref:sensor histidine kinase n=1 Tax=unclassified Pseudomonas TaxID=196821 RepID=UPI0002608AD6|nr:HAMP domain-containing sensor histidine kinase [Pseudomonas sp. M47T1]EIK95864.1 sensor histidine kinase ColS [Pseudomonas sp. M47T1]
MTSILSRWRTKRSRQSLAQRIVVVFALMTTLVAGVFAVGIVATVHVVEKKLTTVGLGGNLHRMLMMENRDEWNHRPEKDELFFADDGQGDMLMPPDLAALEPGFHEVRRLERSWYAMVRVINGRKYVLLRDQQGFEERERLLFGVVITGFALSLLGSILLGWLLSRKVMAPVIRLAGQVRHRDQLLDLAPPLAPDYAADEVGTLAKSFDDTLGRLRSALVREKLFTGDVSHELRTPLMVLASSSELLLENPGLDPRAREQVSRIARASSAMRQLVDTFLLLARAENAEGGQGQGASIEQVAQELIETWRTPIEEKGLELVYLPQEAGEGAFNQTFLGAVMGNLLRNAWHYTDEGFIRLTLLPGGFKVEDSGIGIPEEKRLEMFRPFVRGDEQRGEGLGLGLSLVQRICVNEGWSVTLTSREPHGCCFEVRLALV